MEKFYSQKEILNIWKEKLPSFKKEEMFNIYVENPFCPNQCSYCKHMGIGIKKHIKECKQYYQKILPNQINYFSCLFKKRIPDSIYFGGGTPNIVPAFVLKFIFDQIPNFKKIPNKVIECFPNLMNDEKINLLIENKFSYVSFGIQSLKDEILRYNNRLEYKKNSIKKVIKTLESSGVRVNCDLMVFIGENKESTKEIKRIKEDIITLIEEYKPSLITICPNTFFLRKNKKAGVVFSKKFRQMILDIDKKYKLSHQNRHLSLDNKIIEKEMECSYYFGNISSKEMNKKRIYFPNDPMINRVKNQNVLSFGGYKHRQPHSYNNELIYYNINKDNKGFSYCRLK